MTQRLVRELIFAGNPKKKTKGASSKKPERRVSLHEVWLASLDYSNAWMAMDPAREREATKVLLALARRLALQPAPSKPRRSR